MSIPQHFLVVVISDHYEGGGELAAAAAALIQRDWSGIRPYVIGASTHYRVRPAAGRACLRWGAPAGNAVYPNYLDPRMIDLWLSLDRSGYETARSIVKVRGPAPKGFYRDVFPEPVVEFGQALPYPPPDETGLDAWVDAIVLKLNPWKERLWHAFEDSS